MTTGTLEYNANENDAVADWRNKLPKNCIVGWKVYEGPEVPTTPAAREELRTQLLNDLWALKKMLEVLPRHQHYTVDQFEAGFCAEANNLWLPIVQRLKAIAYHWRHLYPGIDITRRSNFPQLAKLIEDLPVPGKLCPESFRNELFDLASQFRTYNMCYFRMIDDEVIREKLSLLVNTLTTASDHYSQDWRYTKEPESPSPQGPSV